MQNTSNYFNYDILNKVKLGIEVTTNPYNLALDDLFLMGARVNPKRSFLFISQLLGKHLAVRPDTTKLAGHLLANLFVEQAEGQTFSDLSLLTKSLSDTTLVAKAKRELAKSHKLAERTLFIGFAETATGLGHAVFSALDNAYYIHTTREQFDDLDSLFNFEEEHSHATSHLCYLTDKSVLETIDKIVLVDDEVTTGNTCLNLIRSLNNVYSDKKYSIVSLLDWRTPKYEEAYIEFKKELGLDVEVISLIKGELDIIEDATFNDEDSLQTEGLFPIAPLTPPKKIEVDFHKEGINLNGLFGLESVHSPLLEEQAKNVGELLKKERRGRKTLCIGNGELIYTPSRISSYMGDNVFYQSSTRSPIFVSQNVSHETFYPIKDRIDFKVNGHIPYYLYNLNNTDYDEVIIFVEKWKDTSYIEHLSSEIQNRGIPYVSYVLI